MSTTVCLDDWPFPEFFNSMFWVETLARISSLTYSDGEGEPGPLSLQEFADSMSGPQLKSKFGMMSLIIPNLSVANKIVIAGGWYGLLALMVARVTGTMMRSKTIISMDRDERANRAANWLLDRDFLDRVGAKEVFAQALLIDVCDAAVHDIVDSPKNTLAINPSAEHFSDFDFERYVHNYLPGTRFIVSSTNMQARDHVSCVNSSQQLAERLDRVGIRHSQQFYLSLGHNDWQRFYVTGVLER